MRSVLFFYPLVVYLPLFFFLDCILPSGHPGWTVVCFELISDRPSPGTAHFAFPPPPGRFDVWTLLPFPPPPGVSSIPPAESKVPFLGDKGARTRVRSLLQVKGRLRVSVAKTFPPSLVPRAQAGAPSSRRLVVFRVPPRVLSHEVASCPAAGSVAVVFTCTYADRRPFFDHVDVGSLGCFFAHFPNTHTTPHRCLLLFSFFFFALAFSFHLRSKWRPCAYTCSSCSSPRVGFVPAFSFCPRILGVFLSLFFFVWDFFFPRSCLDFPPPRPQRLARHSPFYALFLRSPCSCIKKRIFPTPAGRLRVDWDFWL